MFAAKDTLLTRPSGGYQISRSLRFNSADSAYLNRTPASAGNRRTWTFSTWVKRSQLNSGNAMLATVNGSALNYFAFGTSTGDFLAYAYFDGASDVFGVNTSGTSVFRDVSAWYHIVLSVDTTQATAANRVKIYVNNVEQALGGTYPTQNYDTPINNTISNLIGGATGSYTAYLSDQYMTEINFIDGQALTPSSFGQTDAQTGVWGPKAYSGSYGTNGFYLNFSDNSNTTAATLGKDYSGNGNNWTPNGFSVTAGAGNDSLVDVPTPYGVDTGVGGTVRGNYATLNPLNTAYTDKTFSDGNLNVTGSTTNQVGGHSTMQIPTTGQWYAECVMTAYGSGSPFIGVNGGTTTLGAGGASYRTDGTKELNGTGSSYGATWTTNDVIGIAVDTGSGSITFYKNGTSQGVAYTTLNSNFTNGLFFSCQGAAGTTTFVYNFGQRPFAYTAPSGFKALCTQNLPTPTIGATTATQAGKYFNTVLYTGNGGTQSVTGVGFQPDFSWIKTRSGTNGHAFEDAVRGAGKTLFSNETGAEFNFDSYFTAFTSDGFNLALGGGSFNTSSGSYVAWNWKANGSGSSNTAGSITSTVSASTTSGFSIVTYTGTGANATVGHGLGVAPSMVIVKRRSATSDWPVYHTSIGATKGLYLNNTFDASTSSTLWNNTAPTSTVFTVGTDSSNTGVTHVAYCFAPILGYSSIGSYTGNGSADGPFVFTGMCPAFVIIKAISGTGTGNWVIQDDMRSPSNVSNKTLYANLSNAEDTSYSIDFLSNGFKLRSASFDATNQSGANYAYIAFAENPFKYSLAR